MSKTKTEKTKPEAFKQGKTGLDESLLIYLALRNIVKQWKKPPTHWGAAAHQLALRFGERFISPPAATEKR